MLFFPDKNPIRINESGWGQPLCALENFKFSFSQWFWILKGFKMFLLLLNSFFFLSFLFDGCGQIHFGHQKQILSSYPHRGAILRSCRGTWWSIQGTRGAAARHKGRTGLMQNEGLVKSTGQAAIHKTMTEKQTTAWRPSPEKLNTLYIRGSHGSLLRFLWNPLFCTFAFSEINAMPETINNRGNLIATMVALLYMNIYRMD